MKKKITLAVLIAVVALGLTACTNTEVSSVGTTTTPVTTPVVTTVNTTITEATTTSEQLTTEPSSDVVTSEEQTEAVVSDETTTSEQEEVTTTTSEQLGSTTTSKKSTTTVGTTTTKKPTTVTTTKTTTTKKPTVTTTTKKKTTTTTTKKKTTTTTTTAKKQEITTTTSPVIKITQSDVDKLVNELQEYSNSKCDFDSLFYTEEEMWERIARKTPSNSSWGGTNRYNIYESLEERQAEQWLKDEIDYWYENCPNCHVVIYAEYFPDGFVWEGEMYYDYPCYVFWCLR